MSVTTSMFQPATPTELEEAVRSSPHVIAIGAGTKPRLSRVPEKFVRISTVKLSGIVEYEPEEFTFTALAGTPLRDVVAALAERGQYLPFDPALVRAGSTLGGAVASGLSGPGRFRFGGVRDFILGVRFVDGEARLLRLGGKVVKNAAGFDVPKFLVGSAGRFGAIAEMTFKVFPRPLVRRTVRLEAKTMAEKVALFTELAKGRWDVEALDAAFEEPAVYVRLGGPQAALDALAGEILARWRGAPLTPGEADYLWQTVTELRWAHSGGTLVKFALTPAQVEEFVTTARTWPDARGWISAGGNVGYVSLPAGATLPELQWRGVTLRGDGPLWHGPHARFDVMRAVKAALDPNGRFPGLDD